MKKIRTIGLVLTILVALGTGNVVTAAATAPTEPVNTGEPIQSHNKRQKSPHSARKEAAKRLKPVYQQEQQQKLQDEVKAHRNHTDQSHTGGVK